MRIIALTILTILLGSGSNIESNYLEYHIEMSEIEELISNEEFILAEAKIESLLTEYEPKFAKDFTLGIKSKIKILEDHGYEVDLKIQKKS
ncbi:MAG: hypothetical protein IH946_06660 [Bacteroidetes bacterium]|nr:hypothetical protein [Bacteroidota bacterium]